MKKKITGIISFIGAAGLLIGIFFLLIKEPLTEISEYAFALVYILLLISTLCYIKWTNFGNNKPPEIKSIDYENQILKMKIEQQELKKKLDN